VIAYLHPIGSIVAIALGAWAGSLGLRARGGRVAARARHRVVGPWVLALFVANWLGGLASVEWGRHEIEEAATGHFVVGSVIVVLLAIGGLLSRWIAADARARTIHPLLGGVALLLCAVQVFLGLQLLP
jgi:hypothetical protein